MNLAGVEKVFELEQEIDRMQRRMRNLERAGRAGPARSWRRRSTRVRRSFKAELVRYEPPGQALVPPDATVRVRITRSR